MTIYESKVQMLKIAEDFNFGKFSKYVEFNPREIMNKHIFPYAFSNSFKPESKLLLPRLNKKRYPATKCNILLTYSQQCLKHKGHSN